MSAADEAGSPRDSKSIRDRSDSSSALRRFFRRPPGPVFHVVVAALALLRLWAASTPGEIFLPAILSSAALVVTAFVWLVRSATFLIASRRGVGHGRPLWLVVAPIGAIVVVGLLAGHVPHRTRWARSEPAFQAYLQALPEPTPGAVSETGLETTWQLVPGDAERLGQYDIDAVYRVGDAVIFYDSDGAFLNDAGIAYLPDGPSLELETGSFEAPQFEHLSGPWYSWTASW